ncbi:MAG: hypothetical protein ACLRSW_17520 [Christensenellaceae bacterium]
MIGALKDETGRRDSSSSIIPSRRQKIGYRRNYGARICPFHAVYSKENEGGKGRARKISISLPSRQGVFAIEIEE